MSLDLERLEQSFAKIKPVVSEFSASFYRNLFTDYPAAQLLFAHTDMKRQQEKLFRSLVLVVENLRHSEQLAGVLKGLGAQHGQYDALPEHYPLVGKTLLKTFAAYPGEDWIATTEQAWADAYTAISALMLEGADYSSDTKAKLTI